MTYGTLAEKKALQRRSGWWAGGAVLAAILAMFGVPALMNPAGSPRDALEILLMILQLLSGVLWVIGCAYYARSKGWSGFMGILGILTIIGILVLILLPDKWGKALKAAPPGPSGPPDLTNYPR